MDAEKKEKKVVEVVPALKIVRDNFALISLFFFFSSSITLSSYYNAFNIPIFDYLSFGEIITRFLNEAIGYVIMILAAAIFIFWSKEKSPFTNAILFLVAAGLYGLLGSSGINPFDYPSFLVSICCVAFIYFFSMRMGSELSRDFMLILLVTFPLLLNVFTVPKAMAELFKNTKTLHTTSVEFGDSTKVDSLGKRFVIGMTESYIFLFDSATQKPLVKNRSGIKSLIIGFLPMSGNLIDENLTPANILDNKIGFSKFIRFKSNLRETLLNVSLILFLLVFAFWKEIDFFIISKFRFKKQS